MAKLKKTSKSYPKLARLSKKPSRRKTAGVSALRGAKKRAESKSKNTSKNNSRLRKPIKKKSRNSVPTRSRVVKARPKSNRRVARKIAPKRKTSRTSSKFITHAYPNRKIPSIRVGKRVRIKVKIVKYPRRYIKIRNPSDGESALTDHVFPELARFYKQNGRGKIYSVKLHIKFRELTEIQYRNIARARLKNLKDLENYKQTILYEWVGVSGFGGRWKLYIASLGSAELLGVTLECF